MDFYAEHGEWWNRAHNGERPVLPALGLFKAVRNFVHPLLKSQQNPQLGYDWHAEAQEAVGDMLMYCCSVGRACGMAELPSALPSPSCTILELAVGRLCVNAGDLVIDAATDSPARISLQRTLSCVLTVAHICAIDPVSAAAVSLKKVRSK